MYTMYTHMWSITANSFYAPSSGCFAGELSRRGLPLLFRSPAPFRVRRSITYEFSSLHSPWPVALLDLPSALSSCLVFGVC